MARHASSVNTSGNDHNLPEVLIHAERAHLPLVPPLDGGEKEHYLPDALQLVPPPINTHNLYTTQPGSGTPSGSTIWKKKRLWLPLATLVFLAAIVGGIVGGFLIHRDPPSRQASNEPPSSTAESVPLKASPALSSTTAESVPPKASSVVSSTTTTTTTLLQPSAKPLNSSLASVAWKDNEGLEYRRLYYQDSAGNIKESAWNNSANGWYSSSKALAQARQNSPLAAAVAGNLSWPFVGDWNPDDDRSSQLIGCTAAATQFILPGP